MEKPPLASVARTRPIGIGVIQRIEVPAAVGGEGRDRVLTLSYQPPEVFRRAHPTGISATHADDRQGLARALLNLPQTLVSIVQINRGALEIAPQLLVIGHCWLSSI